MHFAMQGYSYSLLFERNAVWDGFAPELQPGWLAGRRVDLSDIQWRSFRNGMPKLVLFYTLFAIVSRVVGDRHRVKIGVIAGILQLVLLHGCAAIFFLLSVLSNYTILHSSKKSVFLLWAYNLLALFAVRLSNGFMISSALPALRFLNTYRGIMRWDICFNISVLRMISYGIDRKRNDKDGLLRYMAYITYPPLYFAGPIVAYEDFEQQMASHGKRRASPRVIAKYALRFIADWISLEIITHVFYFNSLAKHKIGLHYAEYGLRFGTLEVAMTGWWVLCFMWLKFATIWRFSRLFALLEGLDPPENMTRCFANNYSIAGFWKGWHSSYNRWIVKYVYIPLGGTEKAHFNIWLIFLFVALWHDLEWRLLSWAWLICLAFLPEIVLKRTAASPKLQRLRSMSTLYRCICGCFAAISIAALLIANLTGFVIGMEGLKTFLSEIASDRAFICSALFVFYSAAQLMFAIRGYSW